MVVVVIVVVVVVFLVITANAVDLQERLVFV